MENVAGIYRNQGKWKEAEALQVVVMEKWKYCTISFNSAVMHHGALQNAEMSQLSQ
jgi:hypothetical protein